MIINSGTFIQLLFFTNSQYIFKYVFFLLQYIYATPFITSYPESRFNLI